MLINPTPDMSGSMSSIMGGGMFGAPAGEPAFQPRSFDLVHMPCLPMVVLNTPKTLRKHIIKLNESLSSSSFMIGQGMMNNHKLTPGTSTSDLERNAKWIQ